MMGDTQQALLFELPTQEPPALPVVSTDDIAAAHANEATPTEKTLLLIDGHSLAFRVYYGLEHTNMTTSQKEPVWAIYGFLNTIFRLTPKVNPSAIALSFDVGRETFRTEQYPLYKANRESMPEPMRVQMDAVREAVEVMGIPIFELPGYEADDVIGTLAQQAQRDGYQVTILTGDQDAFQLVTDDGSIQVLVPPRTPKDDMKWYTRDAVFAKLGVYPEQVPDFKGLKGDTSDNIPGVPGIGDKTASKLLQEYGTLEGVYAALPEIKGKLQEKLTTYRDQAFLSKDLAIIRTEAPVVDMPQGDGAWSDCHLSIPSLEKLMAYLDRWELKTFRTKLGELAAPFLDADQRTALGVTSVSNKPTATSSPVLPAAASDLPPIVAHDEPPITVVTNPIALASLCAAVKAAGVAAIDVETTGLDPLTDRLVGISIACAPQPMGTVWTSTPAVLPETLAAVALEATTPQLHVTRPTLPPEANALQCWYIPLGHVGEGSPETQLDEATALRVLVPLLQDEQLWWIAHNAKFELQMVAHRAATHGLNFPVQTAATRWADTLIASYVLQSDRGHGLKALAEALLGIVMQPITTLIGTGKNTISFEQVPFAPAVAYATRDAWTTLLLAHRLLGELQDNPDLVGVYYGMDLPLVRVLAAMESEGVGLDTAYLGQLSAQLQTRLDALETTIYQHAGGLPFNINSTQQVGKILFEQLGIAPLKKTKGKTGYSTDAKVLEQLKDAHPIVADLIQYRQLFKLKSTYVDNLPEMVSTATGRLHTHFNQTITATGRLSSSDPNLQNIPIRTEEGRLIRAAFTTRDAEKFTLLSADYSQIELRLLAHVSEDPNLIAAFAAGEDIHAATAALVFGVPLVEVTKAQRYQAKAVNFGVIYGQTPHGLSQQLQIGRDEAAGFIERYFQQYGAVKAAIEGIQQQAKTSGQVSTLFGRVRDLRAELNSSQHHVREFAQRAAFNTVLQGSAADLMKLAMIRLQAALVRGGYASKLILQVHDEVVLDVAHEELPEVQALVEDCLQLGQPLKVPLVVDVATGTNWLEGG